MANRPRISTIETSQLHARNQDITMTQQPIAKITVPEDAYGRKDITLEIMRETGKDADWHNRYVQTAETKVQLRSVPD